VKDGNFNGLHKPIALRSFVMHTETRLRAAGKEDVAEPEKPQQSRETKFLIL
jgi:hypothetical protein